MIGGIFIKSNNPKYLARWYEDNLGIGFGTGVYFSFKWRHLEDPESIGYTVFSFFPNDTEYFNPSHSDFMLNIRVSNLDETRKSLKEKGVVVDDKVETYDNGKFGWAIDCNGNKLELWEPIDKGFEDYHQPMELFNNVTGLGGIFIKCKNVAETIEWYNKSFGFNFKYSFSDFEWRELNEKEKIGNTVLTFFSQESDYFSKSTKGFMLNLRVKNLDDLIKNLTSSEVEVDPKTEDSEFGKFAWIYDPEGNRIELWEPK